MLAGTRERTKGSCSYGTRWVRKSVISRPVRPPSLMRHFSPTHRRDTTSSSRTASSIRTRRFGQASNSRTRLLWSVGEDGFRRMSCL